MPPARAAFLPWAGATPRDSNLPARAARVRPPTLWQGARDQPPKASERRSGSRRCPPPGCGMLRSAPGALAPPARAHPPSRNPSELQIHCIPRCSLFSSRSVFAARTGRRSRGFAFLAGFGPDRFMKQFSESDARFVKLRFRVSDRAPHDFGNLVVLISLHIVQDEHCFVTRRELFDGALQIHAVDRTGQAQIRAAKIPPRPPRLVVRFGHLLKRRLVTGLLAQLHEHDVNREPVQPRRESGFASKSSNLPEKLEEGLLREVLRLRNIADHAQTQRIHAAAVQTIQPLEGCSITLLRQPDGFRFRHLTGFGSSRSGHATRGDASVTAMRRPSWKLHSQVLPAYSAWQVSAQVRIDAHDLFPYAAEKGKAPSILGPTACFRPVQGFWSRRYSGAGIEITS